MKRLLFSTLFILLISGPAFSEEVENAEVPSYGEADAGRWVEVEGTVARKSGKSFYVGPLKIVISEETEIIGDMAFHNNDLVKVEGTMTGPSSMKADKIEIEDLIDGEDEPEAELKTEQEVPVDVDAVEPDPESES